MPGLAGEESDDSDDDEIPCLESDNDSDDEEPVTRKLGVNTSADDDDDGKYDDDSTYVPSDHVESDEDVDDEEDMSIKLIKKLVKTGFVDYMTSQIGGSKSGSAVTTAMNRIIRSGNIFLLLFVN